MKWKLTARNLRTLTMDSLDFGTLRTSILFGFCVHGHE